MKKFNRARESTDRLIKQKQDTLKTVIDTIEKNSKFKKLLIYFLNSLEVFVSPPNREIKINAKIILKLEGVRVLRAIMMVNLKNEDIVTQASDIIWKLIGVYDIVDQELARLFVEQGGHEAVIEVLLQKDEGKASLSLIKILNGLVQIPSLVNPLLDAGLAQTVKLVNDLYPDDLNIIALNFDTMKKISNQKSGRDFIVTKGLVPSVLNNIEKVGDQGNAKAVLNGFSLLDNIARNDEGKKEIKDSNGLDTICDTLNIFDENPTVLKSGAKLISKIATEEDMEKLIKQLKENGEKLDPSNPDQETLKKLKNDLSIASNLMLLDQIGQIGCKDENFKILKDLYMKLNEIQLEGKNDHLVKTYVKAMKNFMVVFARAFNLMPECYDKDNEKGADCVPLHAALRSEISKNYEELSKRIEQLSKTEDPQKWENSHYNSLRNFFSSYDNLIAQEANNTKEGEKINPDIIKILEYVISNIISKGSTNFHTDDRSNYSASKVLKLASELIKKYPEDTENLAKSIETCFPYLCGMLQINENPKTLGNDLEVCKDLIAGEGETKLKNRNELIPVVVKFMSEKPKYRYPNYVNLEILDNYLTNDFINEMKTNPDPKINSNYQLDYIGGIVSVMAKGKEKKKKGAKEDENLEKESGIEAEVRNEEVEQNIKDKGSELLSKLVSVEDFNKKSKLFQSNAKKFNPGNYKSDEYNALLENLLYQGSLINDKNNLDSALNEDLVVKDLVKKELTYIEGFKRDANNEKNPKYKEIIEASTDRLKEYLDLLKKIEDSTIKQYNETNDPKYLEKYKNILQTNLDVFEKSTDTQNLEGHSEQAKKVFPFINKNNEQLHLGKPTDPSSIEKLINSMLKCLRNNINDEFLDAEIIKSLISIATQKPEACNLLVKGGCPRLLLQVMEQTNNKDLTKSCLELLKMITLSSNDNLVMVANQNVASKLFEIRAKNAANEDVTEKCDLIVNEIMKLPGQEDQAIEIINDCVKELNDIVKEDYKNPEVKNKLLNNLEIINSFTSNKKIIESTLENKEFFDNLKTIVNNSIKDEETTDRNEGLVTNSIALAKKVQENIPQNSEDKDEKNNEIVKLLLDDIKNKSNYTGVLLTSTKKLGEMINDEPFYQKYVDDKLDTDFIDKLLEISDNYLDNQEVSKEINNILSGLCLRNPDKFGDYIVSKGGLANVIEDLKGTVTMNDEKSKETKLNGLKMLDSLLNKDENLEVFVKSKGVELLNGIVKNEVSIAPKIKEEPCLFKTRCTINVKTQEMINEEEKLGHEDNNEDKEKKKEDYFVYCVKIMKKGIDKGKKEIIDDNIIKNLTLLTQANYPDKKLFAEVTNILTNDSCVIPEVPTDNQNLMKLASTNRAKFYADDEIKEKFEKLQAKIGPQTFKTEEYKKGIKDTIHEEMNKEDTPEQRKENNKLLTYIALNLNNNDFINSFDHKDDLLPFYNKLVDLYKPSDDKKPHPDLDEGTAIALMKTCNFLAEKELLDINDPNTIGNVTSDALPFYKPDNYFYAKHYNEELDKLFDKSGIIDKTKEQTEDAPIYTEPYNEYLIKSFPYNSEFLKNYHQNFLAAPQGTYPEISKEKEENIDKTLKKVEDFYKQKEGGEDLKEGQIVGTCGDVIDLIDDMNTEGVYNKDDENDEKNIKLRNRAIKSWQNANMAIEQDEKNKIVSDEGLVNNLIDKANDTVKLNIDIPELRNIMSTISNKINDNDEINKKLFDYAKEDMNKHADDKDAKSKDIEILSNLSKYSEPLKNEMKDQELFNDLKKEYEKEDLSLKDRNNLDNILRNATKSSINTEKMVNEDPEFFKTLKLKVLEHPVSGTTDEEKEIAKKEVEMLIDTIKDPNNFKTLQSKNIITDDDIDKLEKAYSDTIPEVNALIGPTIAQIKESNKSKQEGALLKKDEENLKALGLKVEEVFNEHKNELSKLSKEGEEGEEKKEKKKKDDTLQDASAVRKGRMSYITDTLLFNPNNNEIKSNLSTKNNNETRVTLDNILSLLRKLYNEYKTSDNSELNDNREMLIKECLRQLKNLSLSPDNHVIINENGLVNFCEKLSSEEMDKNPIEFHTRSKDVMKNCSHSPNACTCLIESPLLDKLIEELLNFYDKGEESLNDDNQKKIFLYDNIIFSNVCKNKEGFEKVFNKIGKDKLIEIGKKTGNSDILEAIIVMLINFIKHQEKIEDLEPEFWKDVLYICNKALNLKGRTPSLDSKTLILISLIYLPFLVEHIAGLETVSHINYDFEQFHNDKEFLDSTLKCLSVITNDNVQNSNETVNSKLIVKLKDEVVGMNKNESQELILNLTNLYNSLVKNNIENINNFTELGITDNILYWVNLYSTKVYGTQMSSLLRTITTATMNQDIMSGLNEGDIKKTAFIKRMSSANYDASKAMGALTKALGENSNYSQNLLSGNTAKQDSDKINKQITVNLINTLDQLTISKKSNEYLGKSKLSEFLIQTLKNKSVDIDVISTVLHVFGNYLYEVKSNNEKLSLEEIYEILQQLQKDYYSNSDILTNINYICGSIIKNIDNKEFIKKFFMLISESTKCQDWNAPLILVALKLIYQDLTLQPFLIDEIYEELFPLLINVLNVNKDHLEIQSLIYKIFLLFSKNNIYGYAMLNGGLMECVKNTLQNTAFDKNPSGKINIRKNVFKLMEILSVDEGNSKKISDELIEYLLKELDDETYIDDNTPILSLLSSLCKHKYCLQPFVQFKGIEILQKWLQKEENNPEFIIQLLDLLSCAAQGGDEFKSMMQKLGIVETVNNIIKNYGMFEKQIEYKGKSLIFLINSAKVKLVDVEDVDIQDIKIANPIKSEVRNFLTSGKQVEIVNASGVKKEMHLSFTQDLLKISAKKVKSNLPPKPKYQIDTSTFKKLIRGHSGHDIEVSTNQFKKGKTHFRKMGGLFSKPPDPKLCFSIIGPIQPGEFTEKSLDVICKSEKECNMWMEYLETIIKHFQKNKTIKTNVEIRKKIDDE